MDQVAEEEKNAVVNERKELFKARRQKQAEIRKVELKMERVEIVSLVNGFIQGSNYTYLIK